MNLKGNYFKVEEVKKCVLVVTTLLVRVNRLQLLTERGMTVCKVGTLVD